MASSYWDFLDMFSENLSYLHDLVVSQSLVQILYLDFIWHSFSLWFSWIKISPLIFCSFYLFIFKYFLMWTICKVFIEFVIILLLFLGSVFFCFVLFCFVFWLWGMWVLASWPGIKPTSAALESVSCSVISDSFWPHGL